MLQDSYVPCQRSSVPLGPLPLLPYHPPCTNQGGIILGTTDDLMLLQLFFPCFFFLSFFLCFFLLLHFSCLMLMFFCSIFHCFFLFFNSSLLCFQVCLSFISPFLAFTLFFFTYLSLFGSILFGGPGGSDLMTYDSTQGNFFFHGLLFMLLHSLSLNYLFLYQYICLLIIY